MRVRERAYSARPRIRRKGLCPIGKASRTMQEARTSLLLLLRTMTMGLGTLKPTPYLAAYLTERRPYQGVSCICVVVGRWSITSMIDHPPFKHSAHVGCHTFFQQPTTHTNTPTHLLHLRLDVVDVHRRRAGGPCPLCWPIDGLLVVVASRGPPGCARLVLSLARSACSASLLLSGQTAPRKAKAPALCDGVSGNGV